ncbi:MAG: LLM class flavin-dependent oxidoreductase [Actinobacteria bacterium]|nr:LLM class flavin-dependent oxidoreductase [Actinomycetota bacterium]NIS32168.1 LLM class flavin-dependent oxidoreductase [Actinomycetota bacterium]NIT96113.1 LLM class flavin-dependent oxidoreductase [Actinomycetota bacterium]NIU19792.1 LLM class flavin-dependent oxidoreductase [Actinomycetota bacterium]NIU67229.1 LLM class flavin-dependent oxidoreductase [Actinomycetota bacterium]
MKKSINLIPETPIAEMVGLATHAEDLGFDRCWVYDEGLVTRDVYVTMAAIAAATERLEVGPGITNPYTRHPAQTASAVASLDEATGGRAFLGIGAGGSLTLDPIGLARSRPLGAVRETIEVCRALFGGEAVDYDGEHVTLSSARLDYGRPEIEIWLAGRGPRMLQLGGAAADGVMLDFIHRPSLGGYVDLVRTGAAPADRTPRICYSTAVVTDADDLEFVRPHMTYRLVDAPPPVKEALGLGPDDVERIRSAMGGGLRAAADHVRDEWIEPFIVRGTPAECAATLSGLVREHGFEEFLVPMFEMPDAHGYLTRVADVLGQVVP